MCIQRVYSIKFNKQHFFSCTCEPCGHVWYDIRLPLNTGYLGTWLEPWAVQFYESYQHIFIKTRERGVQPSHVKTYPISITLSH